MLRYSENIVSNLRSTSFSILPRKYHRLTLAEQRSHVVRWRNMKLNHKTEGRRVETSITQPKILFPHDGQDETTDSSRKQRGQQAHHCMLPLPYPICAKYATQYTTLICQIITGSERQGESIYIYMIVLVLRQDEEEVVVPHRKKTKERRSNEPIRTPHESRVPFSCMRGADSLNRHQPQSTRKRIGT